MDNLVNWLVSDDQIAEIASAYTAVIVVDYIVRCASRTFMIPFYLTGQARFETLIDLGAGVLTLSVIAIVGTTTYDLSLTAIGWIQVIIGMAKIITKVSYVALRGWLTPYRRGLLRHLSLKVSLSTCSNCDIVDTCTKSTHNAVSIAEHFLCNVLSTASFTFISWVAS